MAQWGLLSYGENDVFATRFGFTIPKYVGNAVTRNRLRRWGREHFRKTQIELGSIDINVVFLKKSFDFYKELSKADFDTALGKALGKIRESA